MNRILNRIGEAIKGTSLEPILDQAFYTVVGPREISTTVGDYTGTFAAHSSREYHGVQTLDDEKEITETFLSHLSEDDIAWDIGANVGWHAILMGQIAPTVAFEPNPRSFSKLHRNICLNPTCDVVPVCAGLGPTADSETTSTTGIGEGAGAAVLPIFDVDTDEYRSTLVMEGQTDPPLFTSPDAIKLDVQGLESDVLTSFGEQLDTIRLLMVEYHKGRIVGDWTAEKLHEYVCNSGFSVVETNIRRDDVIRIYEQT
ncbi:FkbM family methyltransferase [Halorubrum sp. CBA1125]|uniref:FkbM family methyltransferase n=1 Tax=Halorubrum sp. CBA1125 TaxID=2668072 RepID=UPI0012E83BA6|nr:FkbM family methyltransferase [Halorubrum sp. CBA1125]MUW13424.1 FkbM family methyltransferase [Halorubrum sp. CBA1125]